MAWNEPDNDNKGKDPWGGNNNNEGPPDLDEVLQNLKKKLFKNSGGNNNSDGNDPLPSMGMGAIIAVLLVFLGLWMLTGFYTVEPAEKAVVLRFGAVSDTTGPGLHWRFPSPIETEYKVDVSKISSFTHHSKMLTKDENIIDFELAVQWKINNPERFLFQDSRPIKSIHDVIETVVREVVGKNNLDYILTEGRDEIAENIRSNTQALITQYNVGIKVTSINMQPAKPPEEVKGAFDDAIKAREDKERSENQAEAYANEVIPKARGAASRVVQEAAAYKNQVIAKAEGETHRFLAVKAVYEQAPEVTRERMYLEMSETVLANTKKIILDAEGSNNVTYLPLDKLINQQNTVTVPVAPVQAPLLSREQAALQPAYEQSRQRVSERSRRSR